MTTKYVAKHVGGFLQECRNRTESISVLAATIYEFDAATLQAGLPQFVQSHY